MCKRLTIRGFKFSALLPCWLCGRDQENILLADVFLSVYYVSSDPTRSRFSSQTRTKTSCLISWGAKTSQKRCLQFACDFVTRAVVSWWKICTYANTFLEKKYKKKLLRVNKTFKREMLYFKTFFKVELNILKHCYDRYPNIFGLRCPFAIFLAGHSR